MFHLRADPHPELHWPERRCGTSPPTQVVYSHNDDQPSGLSAGIQDLACIERHWAIIRSRLMGRGIQSPRQLLSGRSMAQAVWILPTQLSGNPGWLRPLRRLLSRVDVLTLFHALDRSEGAPEPPAHQELIPPQLRALQKPTSPQQLSAIFTDDRWLQVRSSAPLQSWINALQREGIEPPMENEDHRRRVAVDMLRTLGAKSNGPAQTAAVMCLASAVVVHCSGP
jgi:hypothetical protein